MPGQKAMVAPQSARIRSAYAGMMNIAANNIPGPDLGDDPALSVSGRRVPDRRQVSMRWLTGAVLTGLTSIFLMGGALFAALDGRHQLALPAHALQGPPVEAERQDGLTKGARLARLADIPTEAAGANVMMVSTITREDDRNVVKVRPFLHVETPLAIVPPREFEYPSFNPLTVFSESGEPEPVDTTADSIYGAEVESEVTITTVAFDLSAPEIEVSPLRSEDDDEIEAIVRNAAPALNSGATTVASMAYFDPGRFSFQDTMFISTPEVTITAENVSIRPMANFGNDANRRFDERFAVVRTEAPIAVILAAEGIDPTEAETLEKIVSTNLGSQNLLPEDRLRIAYATGGDMPPDTMRTGRISIYRGGSHIVTVARNDAGSFVYAQAPEPVPQIAQNLQKRPVLPAARLPSAYDAIYRAALAQGLNEELAGQLVRIFAFDVDFNSRIALSDELSVFVSLEDGKTEPSEASEILFASIQLGTTEHKYYRFRDPENGQVDYYDETGKSAKKFLLRQPVPNGRFRSAFGRRFHPILRVRKMHWGVDWAAPRGTPILAAGNGVVEKAGWASGYGKHTKIRHANGYVTSYSHQTRFAKGVVPGARVRQGQVIGYVGSTGLSTGPHLHYEVIVNGNKVDPMRIRLPKGRVLEGDTLTAFADERDRIDDLLRDETEETQLASN